MRDAEMRRKLADADAKPRQMTWDERGRRREDAAMPGGAVRALKEGRNLQHCQRVI
jgi:YD repeat-containing protein